MPFPTPDTRHPLPLPDGTHHPGCVFLKAALDHPNIDVGDYTYAFDRNPPDDWAARLAPYLYEGMPERLTIGRFCQIAHGVRFITSSANHRHDGATTFPFAIFGGGLAGRASMPRTHADTYIGHDVWFGDGATVLPGARIGNGVIVAAKAVVGGNVPDYAVVAGNPGRVVRMRFPPDRIAALLDLGWWDWPIDRILAAEDALCGSDGSALDPG